MSSSNLPSPTFVHHGIKASCCSTFSMNDTEYLIVGTSNGKCSLCNISTYKFIETIYDDPEKRSIVGVGSTHENTILAHVRSFAIIFFSKNESVWEQTKQIDVDHYGFCSIKITPTSLIFPDCERAQSFIRIHKSGKELDRINLGDQVTPLCIDVLSSSETIFVGDDSGTLTISRNEQQTTKKLYSEPIFAVATSNTGLVAVCSTLPPIKCLKYPEFDDSETVNLEYRADTSGCGSLVFLPSGKTLLAGFWDGSIRGFSIKKRQITLFLNFHQQSISSLLWFASDVTEDKKDQMVSCSQDGTVCFWNFSKNT